MKKITYYRIEEMKVSKKCEGIAEQTELLLALRVGKIETGEKGRHSVMARPLCTWVQGQRRLEREAIHIEDDFETSMFTAKKIIVFRYNKTNIMINCLCSLIF